MTRIEGTWETLLSPYENDLSVTDPAFYAALTFARAENHQECMICTKPFEHPTDYTVHLVSSVWLVICQECKHDLMIVPND